MRVRERYLKSIILSFCLSTLMILALIEGAHYFLIEKEFEKLNEQRQTEATQTRKEIAAQFPPGLARPEVATPQSAKAANLFWVESIESRASFALDLEKSPKLIEQLYPGYSNDFVANGGLPQGYFNRVFDPESYVEANGLPTMVVKYSWLGCLDILQKYGADILVLGNSETYRGIIPKQLAEDLASEFWQRPKVLMCAVSGMSPDATTAFLKKAGSLHKQKVKAILFGYSFWFGYSRSALKESYSEKHIAALDGYRTNFTQKLWNVLNFIPRNSEFSMSWDLINPSTKSKFRTDQEKLTEILNRGDAIYNADLDMKVPKVLLADNQKLQKHLQQISAKPTFLSGVNQGDCEFSKVAQELNHFILAARSISEQTFIFRVPTSQIQMNFAPKCFQDKLNSILADISETAGAIFISNEKNKA